jgi:nucleoside-diphosphate-sugar epimerase
MQKKALICGAGGFIGLHLAKRLKKESYWVRGVVHHPPAANKKFADEYLVLDLRILKNCQKALTVPGGFDEVYQLAAERGGAGYMIPGECDMMVNNALININLVSEVIKLKKLPKFFFSSSVCIYPDMPVGAKEISEKDAYPARPENEYGWEKLYTERLLLAHHRKFGLPVRIARFHTTFGPEANWEGGREKAADALCRKVAMAKDGGTIEVWGDGKAVRLFNYIDDLIDGIRILMKSDLTEPVNIGGSQYVSVEELTKTIIKISGKKLKIKYVPGAVGVHSRNFSNAKIRSLGWKPKYTLEDGLKIHYPWVASQVAKKYGKAK